MDAPLPLLFLVGDTGGGHRSAARAVSQALDQGWTGAFQPVICDGSTLVKSICNEPCQSSKAL